MTDQELFADKNGMAHLHDVVLDACGQSLTPEQLIGLFGELPDRVRELARQWGLADTEVRDLIHTHAPEAISALARRQ